MGDTVGDPFKDTSSVSLNPVIKFTTLFGLLAVEIAVKMADNDLKYLVGTGILLVGLWFVYRSFYGMRIPEEPGEDEAFQPDFKESRRFAASAAGRRARPGQPVTRGSRFAGRRYGTRQSPEWTGSRVP